MNLSGYNPNDNKLSFAQQVMKHEYVHFVFDNSYSDSTVPRWYYEGMAEFLSTLRTVDGYLHYGEINAFRLKTSGREKKVNIEALLKADRIPESRKGKIDFYAHALTLIHFCHFKPGMREKLTKY